MKKFLKLAIGRSTEMAERHKIAGKLGAEKAVRLKLGIHSPNYDRRQTGLSAVANQTGIHSPNYPKSKRQSSGMKAARLTMQNRTGIFGLTREQQLENARNGGLSNYKLLHLRMKESGQQARTQRIRSIHGAHQRWHVKRALYSHECPVCLGEEIIFEEQ